MAYGHGYNVEGQRALQSTGINKIQTLALFIDLWHTRNMPMTTLTSRIVAAVADAHSVVQRTTTRGEFIATLPRNGKILEIGPGSSPIVKGDGVRYFDVRDHAALVDRARVSGEDETGCPFIDYVSPVSDLSIVHERFDAVVSSHAVEHQPDLVGHLCSVSKLLEPGGAYYLAVPDKRYCFDHFAKASSLDEVVAAHQQRRTTHPSASVRAHYARFTHNNPVYHWIGIHGQAGATGQPTDLEALCRAADAGDYVDTHAWAFTPHSFRTIVEATTTQHGLSVEQVTNTRFGTLEFYAVLRREDSRYEGLSSAVKDQEPRRGF